MQDKLQAVGKSYKGEKWTYTLKKFTKKNGMSNPQGEIHEGGFGRTWLAEDENQNEVVLKFPLYPGTIEGKMSPQERSIKREIDILEPMSDPPDSIVKFLDRSADSKDLFLVEEYLGDVNLLDKVYQSDNGRGDNNCLSEKLALEYTKQIGEGLDHLHRDKHYHRDLKPSNIMVTERGCVIIDLGVAKGDFNPDKPSTKSQVILRDNNFHCPQHTGQKDWFQVRQECDIYALARITFYMLTGFMTDGEDIWDFEDATTHKMNRNAMDDHMKQFGISEEFRNLIHKALDPEHRYIPQAKSAISEQGWINQIDLIISSGISAGSGGSSGGSGGGSFGGPIGGGRGKPADLLKPHIICNGQRWDINGDVCYLGREHQCPTNKPEFLLVGMPNHHGCARDTGINKSTLRTSDKILIDDDRIEYHHFKIWKENDDYWVKDLQTRTWSGIVEGGHWQQLKPMIAKKLKKIERLSAGYSEQKGPELELSFYSE